MDDIKKGTLPIGLILNLYKYYNPPPCYFKENREFFLNSSDASREFVLKVIETICGGGLYHEEGSRKSFNI